MVSFWFDKRWLVCGELYMIQRCFDSVLVGARLGLLVFDRVHLCFGFDRFLVELCSGTG